jgi:hypothetical protein
LAQVVQGSWTLTDAYGRMSFPPQIRANGSVFRQAVWREPKPGVVAQYREAVETNSRHLFVLADGRWIINHTDDVNPDMGDATAPARHFVADHPLGQGLAAIGIAAVIALLVAGIAGTMKG